MASVVAHAPRNWWRDRVEEYGQLYNVIFCPPLGGRGASFLVYAPGGRSAMEFALDAPLAESVGGSHFRCALADSQLVFAAGKSEFGVCCRFCGARQSHPDRIVHELCIACWRKAQRAGGVEALLARSIRHLAREMKRAGHVEPRA
jgi:hypothetical protein